ncbi:MAG TPA: type II toxin-antitoxin system VapC family toxin [Terriglobales bacterium]|nr:type II toxin-antitoxin system VapC family toxin [Terriglobales bacterium]
MSAPTAVVVDASVVLKWVLPEPGRAEALTLLDGYEAGGLDLLAPRSLLEEMASALAKRCRRRELTPAAAEQAWGWVEARRPLLVDGPSQVAAALKWRQLGDALSASGHPLPGIEARPPSDQRSDPSKKWRATWRCGSNSASGTASTSVWPSPEGATS